MKGRVIARLVLIAVLIGAFATPATANKWKVRDLTAVPDSDQSKLMLVVSKASIQVVRRANGSVLATIDPKTVASIWYDDKLLDVSLGRKWVDAVATYCEAYCDDQNLLAPLAMLAVAGAGYLVAEPFSERQHVVNIRYRDGDRIAWLTLGINWADHVWLMADLSKVTGLKWLNLPLERGKLFWSFDDHTTRFESWWATGDVPLTGSYGTRLWEDGRGNGLLIVFAPSGGGTPRTVAVEPVRIEASASAGEAPEYCLDDAGVRRLLRITLKQKRLVLPVWDAACRRAAAKPN